MLVTSSGWQSQAASCDEGGNDAVQAFSSGWIREILGDHPYDLLVLAAITSHARRLHTGDLKQLPELRHPITGTDTNLLCSFVTNIELADELGRSQKTTVDAIDRLVDLGMIRVCDTRRLRAIPITLAE